MKRCALYLRVSTVDQHPETQLYDLRGLAAQRDFEIVHEYTDKISGAKAKRPALDQMLAAAHRREFDVALVWAADRLAQDEVAHDHHRQITLRRRPQRHHVVPNTPSATRTPSR